MEALSPEVPKVDVEGVRTIACKGTGRGRVEILAREHRRNLDVGAEATSAVIPIRASRPARDAPFMIAGVACGGFSTDDRRPLALRRRTRRDRGR
jgi:hypothetical protein